MSILGGFGGAWGLEGLTPFSIGALCPSLSLLKTSRAQVHRSVDPKKVCTFAILQRTATVMSQGISEGQLFGKPTSRPVTRSALNVTDPTFRPERS
jgi:hypothetical protein